MKKLRVLLLTLVLSVSMLVPEFCMLPAAYADDGAPVVEQTADGAGTSAGAEDGDAGSAEDGEVTSPQDQSGDVTDPGADEAADVSTGDEDAEAPVADDVSEDNDGEAPGRSARVNAAGADGQQSDNDTAEEGGAENSDPADPQDEFTFGAYDRLSFTELDDGDLLEAQGMPDTFEFKHSEYGNSVLVKGTVADINSMRILIDETFNFNEGSIGRLSFDGLRDKDRGMTVYAQVYLDGADTPVSEFPLKKQMGKKEWSNEGEQSVSLGSAEITGEHTVSIGFRIEGKAEDANTTVAVRSIQFCITTVPVMYFHIDESEGTVAEMNASDDHSAECYGTVDLIVPDTFNEDTRFRDEYAEQDSLQNMELEYIRGRGNSTWMDEKKPYKVKFAKDQNLFKFGKNKHWVLLANRYDNSLVRNRMTYWLGRELGKTDPSMLFTPQCVPVEVVMNGEFYGSYLLCEQIRVGKGRVEVTNLDKPENHAPAITNPVVQSGGYLLSMDYEEDEARSFQTDQEMQFFIESPDDYVSDFSDYIKAYTQKVENAIFGDGFMDAENHPYTDYLDLDAAVDYWWVQEFSENGDAYGSGSTYLYKMRDTQNEDETITGGKLYWGPLWDFDFVAWGDLDYGGEPSETLEYTSTPWFDMMKCDPVFINRVKARYTEEGGIREKILEVTKDGGRLDLYKDQMATSYKYDHEKWGAYDSEFTEYGDEIEQLRGWIVDRTEYVDEAVKELRAEVHSVKFVLDGKVVKEIPRCVQLREKDIPEAPEKKGYVFMGWADEEGEYYDEGSRIFSDIVLTAQYESLANIVQPKQIFFKKYDVYCGAYYPDSNENSSNIGAYSPEYTVMPEESYYSEIKWTSSDESIAEVDSEGFVYFKSLGDVTITASISNGVSRSYKLHIINDEDLVYSEGMQIDKTSMTLSVGGYGQIVATPLTTPSWESDVIWVSTNEDVAVVDTIGVVTAVGPGTADILMVDMETREVHKCKVTVKGPSNAGKTVKYKGSTYKITSDKSGKRTAMLVKAKNAKSVVIPASIKYAGKKYSVNKIKAKAFAKSKAVKLTVKTKKLTKKSVKASLRRSKVKTVKVSVGKKYNKKFVKKYKKIFTKKNAGKKVKVS